MKLAPLAQNVVIHYYTKALFESAAGDAKSVQSQIFSLGAELKKDGEDITDDEIQAAILSALIDADGKIDSVNVSDVDAVKKEIKESRSYLAEDDSILHAIETVGTVLGNTAFLHVLAEGLQNIGFKNVDEKTLKAKLEKVISSLKKVTGYPAKVMQKAFTWIASKLGVSTLGQKVAGISGVLLTTIILLCLAIYLFPSLSSGILLVISLSGIVGKSAEIVKLVKELLAHIKEHQAEIKPA